MALSEEIILKRLAFAKYLIHKGNTESTSSEPLSSIAILNYHDALELSFLSILEDMGINPNGLSFMGRYKKVNEALKTKGKEQLGLEPSLEKLKDRRKNLKHKGLIPSKTDIEESKFTTNTLFAEICIKAYNLNPNDISLIELVSNEKVKNYLKESINSRDSDPKKAMESFSLAFEFLLRDYESSKTSRFGRSPFFFGKSMTFLDSFFMKEEMTGRKMEEFVDKVKESIESMQKAVKILAFGFDYRKYIRFFLIIPEPIWYVGSNEPKVNLPEEEIELRQDDFDFCLNYIIECALKLQEFDFKL